MIFRERETIHDFFPFDHFCIGTLRNQISARQIFSLKHEEEKTISNVFLIVIVAPNGLCPKFVLE